jgi:hypothetical protein
MMTTKVAGLQSRAGLSAPNHLSPVLVRYHSALSQPPRLTRLCAGADRPAPDSGARLGAWRAHQTRQGAASLEQALRWRSQLAPEPTSGFFGFHRIHERDRGLMNVIANGALEYSDVKVRGGTRRDPCQQHHCFALWTWRPVKHDHDASPSDQAGALHNSLSHRGAS